MPAPAGNKNAVGHGRPPNPGYSDEECIQLGEDLLIWMNDNLKAKDIVHMSQFYSQLKGIPRSQWESLCDRSCFHAYYERFRDWIGVKILLNKDMPSSYGNRFLPIYFKQVAEVEFEVEKKKIDYLEEKKAKQSFNNDDVSKFLALMNQLSSLQSARNIADINNNADNKS